MSRKIKDNGGTELSLVEKLVTSNSNHIKGLEGLVGKLCVKIGMTEEGSLTGNGIIADIQSLKETSEKNAKTLRRVNALMWGLGAGILLVLSIEMDWSVISWFQFLGGVIL